MSKQLITCPFHIPLNQRNSAPTVFLAGGITGCSDWHTEYWNLIPEKLRVSVLNPRRNEFNIEDPKISEDQISWEYTYLNTCDIISFWFPHETICPITLFEYGKALGQNKNVIIGVDPRYVRKFDLIYQTKNHNDTIEIVDNIPDLVGKLESTIVRLRSSTTYR